MRERTQRGRAPIASRESVLIDRAAQYRAQGYDADTARVMSRMYR